MFMTFNAPRFTGASPYEHETTAPDMTSTLLVSRPIILGGEHSHASKDVPVAVPNGSVPEIIPGSEVVAELCFSAMPIF